MTDKPHESKIEHHPAGAPDPRPFRPHVVMRSVRVYDSIWCALDRHELRLEPTDKEPTGEYHVFRVPDAIVVVPFTPEGHLAMIWQHRHPHGHTHWEVPAGRINLGEAPEAAAHRELAEETGMRAGRLVPLGGFYPINGISDHFAHAFVALDCEPAGPLQLDDSERLLVRTRPLDSVKKELLDGRLRDGFTALALFKALAHLGKL
jgi:ADP-ribose pyrophosphatase